MRFIFNIYSSSALQCLGLVISFWLPFLTVFLFLCTLNWLSCPRWLELWHNMSSSIKSYIALHLPCYITRSAVLPLVESVVVNYSALSLNKGIDWQVALKTKVVRLLLQGDALYLFFIYGFRKMKYSVSSAWHDYTDLSVHANKILC